MDDVRVGRIVRALRRRAGWSQEALGARVGLHRSTISVVERGHWRSMSADVLVRILAALEARLDVEVRWRGGAIDRLIDERHASIAGSAATLLRTWRWAVDAEVTYSIYGERGSIDLLARRDDERIVEVAEIKVTVPSAEETLRRHDVKVRLASRICDERYGWRPRRVGRLLILPESSTTRDLLRRHAVLFDAAYPARGWDVRRALVSADEAPSGVLTIRPHARDPDRARGVAVRARE